jgi:hypothetical protein
MAMTNRELEELFRERVAKFEKLAEHEHRRAKGLPEPFRGDVEGFAKSLDRMAEEIRMTLRKIEKLREKQSKDQRVRFALRTGDLVIPDPSNGRRLWLNPHERYI